MIGKLTALLLAILVANPFCCCFAEEIAAPTAKHACCQAPAPHASREAPENPEPCECGDELRDQWVLGGETKPAPPQWTLLGEICWERHADLEDSSACDTRRALDSPEAARPPGMDLYRVHCRYLL